MSRRVHTADQEFGSDSFLDIIANIVGILIILIVVAGVRVSQQPAVDENTSAVASVDENIPVANSDAQESIEPAISTSEITERQELVTTLQDELDHHAAQLRDVDRELLSTQLAVDAVDRDIQSSNQELKKQQLNFDQSQDESNRIRRLTVQTSAEADKAKLQLVQLSKQVQTVQSEIDTVDKELGLNTRHQKFISDRLQQIGLETRQLQEVLTEIEDSKPAATVLRHRLSPVSKPATDDELHFRLAGGRIAHIPLQQLLSRLKDQVTTKRSAVMKLSQYEGVVGPVGGFTMNYTVERSELGPLQALQMGARGGYRISVSRWVLQPAETLEAEKVSDAVVIGSRFRQILETAAPDTTVTVWLYPDGFTDFGKVRELAHGLHLRIAARPLPEGMPIVGSPNGSQSSGQ